MNEIDNERAQLRQRALDVVGDFDDEIATAQEAADAITALALHLHRTEHKRWQHAIDRAVFDVADAIPSEIESPLHCARCGELHDKHDDDKCQGGDPGMDRFYAEIEPLLPKAAPEAP